MTALDDAVATLQALVDGVQRAAAADIANLWQLIAAGLESWDPADRAAAIALLRLHLPDLVTGYANQLASLTATWYDELAPAEAFAAEVPEELVRGERLATSISWAVNTATSAETALAQLQGSMQRAVADAQRETVSVNASREGVRYRRHCGYAACDWCLVMAGRGAVYRDARSAVRGHDSCRCLAIPERAGMEGYTVPKLVQQASQRYAAASRQLSAEGKAATLQAIVARMAAAASS